MIDESRACHLYAAMLNSRNQESFVNHLCDDFRMSSQSVLEDMIGKDAYTNYISKKLETIRNSGQQVYAELGTIEAYGHTECVVIAQDTKDNLVCIAYLTASSNKITRLDLCIVPPARQAKRTGIYPELSSERNQQFINND
jgi:hypothetical protein